MKEGMIEKIAEGLLTQGYKNKGGGPALRILVGEDGQEIKVYKPVGWEDIICVRESVEPTKSKGDK